MQQFSSISVSSYEAGSLADRLTEQARDGWSVVAIVPTGSTVTAYLSRDADGAAADEVTPGAAAESSPAESATSAASEPTLAGLVHEPAAEPAGLAPSDVTPTAAAPTGATPSGTDASAGITPSAVATDAAGGSAGATTGSTSAAGAAPAGWYADPSGRFELRYWDGGQWTEHVSRAGQQYTDPPVA